ncbi:hypothetical protein CBR_g8503 [Chara braunii]|uniref:Peptidase A1 domain-containing protein n=1 Tax=Chara braunii TaxID=69332 RepID=A0A388KMC1_CHABU|nr:hypothetical protein CBR_g8503 [Chara braunii]|eukprot:GBG71200.1 hypothetical protein CBR_g8503 [Chara braunii]
MAQEGIVRFLLLVVVLLPHGGISLGAATGNDGGGGGGGGGGRNTGAVSLRMNLGYERTRANHLNDVMRELLRRHVSFQRGLSPEDRRDRQPRQQLTRQQQFGGRMSSADFVEERGLFAEASAPGPDPVESLPMLLTSRHYGSAYTMDVYIGSPPQRRSLIVDTGASLMWTFCSASQNLSAEMPNPAFNLEGSSTVKVLTCTDQSCTDLLADENADCNRGACIYIQQYGDGSTTIGRAVQDIVTLSVSNVTHVNFTMAPIGCGIVQTGLVLNMTADGIVGMGRAKYSLNSLVSTLLGIPNIVSTCFNGEDGGFLSVGAPPAPQSAIRFTPLLHSSLAGRG